MAESKMKEVAQLLGVELGEEFKIKNIVGTFRFEESGLYDNDSYLCTYSLKNLLTGQCEIEKPILDKVEKSYLENLCNSQAKGYIDTIQELVDRDTPQKPIKDEPSRIRYIPTYVCPTCGQRFSGIISNFCYHCGQSLDWSDEK